MGMTTPPSGWSPPLMFSFLDLDGNRFYVSEAG
jgi:hypothetical protein